MTFSNASTCSLQAARPGPLPQSSTPCTHTPYVHLMTAIQKGTRLTVRAWRNLRLWPNFDLRHSPSISVQCSRTQSLAHCTEPKQPTHLTLTCTLAKRCRTTLFVMCPACLSRNPAQASCQLLALNTYPWHITMACANNAMHCDSSEQMNRR